MCMLFVKPSNFTLSREYFDSLWKKNPDGLSFYNKDRNDTYKTLSKSEGWEYLIDNHNHEIVCHFRLGTSGNDSLAQVHGFEVCNDEYLLFHNGVLETFTGDFGNDENSLSDTQKLVHLFKHEPIERLVSYLERFEKTSRFLIVEKQTQKYIIPKCASWSGKATFGEIVINFSNSYAIDYKLLDSQYDIYESTNLMKTVSTTTLNPALYYDQDEEQENLELDLIDKLLKSNKKEAVDFIKHYPDIAYNHFMELYDSMYSIPNVV